MKKNIYQAPYIRAVEMETEVMLASSTVTYGGTNNDLETESLPSDNGNGSWGSSNSLWDEE